MALVGRVRAGEGKGDGVSGGECPATTGEAVSDRVGAEQGEDAQRPEGGVEGGGGGRRKTVRRWSSTVCLICKRTLT